MNLPTLPVGVQNIVDGLNKVTGRRAIVIQTRTVADLVSPSKHAASVKRVATLRNKDQEADCYPWATGGATAKTCGLLKFSRVEVQVGDRGLYEFLVNCLWQAMLKHDEKGTPRNFKATKDAFYERVTRPDGTAYPWAVATPDGSTEPVLYLPCAIAKSHGHFYQTTDGVIVPNGQVDSVWTKPDTAPKTQEATDRFIRWRAYRLENIAAVENIGDELTEGGCVEQYRESVKRYAKESGKTVEEIAAEFGVTLDTVERIAASNQPA